MVETLFGIGILCFAVVIPVGITLHRLWTGPHEPASGIPPEDIPWGV